MNCNMNVHKFPYRIQK